MKNRRASTLILILIFACSLVSCKRLSNHKNDDITNENDGPVNIGVYNMYDLETYMTPIWDGKPVLLQGTSIPCMDKREYYTSNPQYSQLVTQGNAAEGTNGAYTYWGEGETMTKWQVVFGYENN